MCLEQQEGGSPENGQINFHMDKKRGVASRQRKSKLGSLEKKHRTDSKVFLEDMVSICATLAKNTNTLLSIIKTAIRKRTRCPTLVQIQGAFPSRRVCVPLPSTGQENI